ncbi:MAG: UDP-N-acetylmuramate dehydrogenase [Phycisphaeraceae bacterium]|nr:MAG: UDP-N-acetylmuramate dehydrogenase [Phycisphaeraceae bacterium]
MLGVSGIFSDLDVAVTLDAPLGPLTWYGVGGRADVLLRPRTVEALATLVKRCRRSRTPLRVLGSGANLLVADEGVDGVVVRLDTPAFTSQEFMDVGGQPVLRVGAGADMAKVLMECTRRGLGGLSQMAGIPASVGGAVRMNAGGAFGAVGDAVRAVTTMTRSGDVHVIPASDITFGYRTTSIADPIILSVEFNLTPEDPIALRDRVKEIFAYKKSTQPLAAHSAGCAFKNPVDPETEKVVSAGKLIDEAGLKGLSVGGATVSTHHANFITVAPGAKAEEVLRLMDLIRARVYERHGIELQTEVVVWRRGERERE